MDPSGVGEYLHKLTNNIHSYDYLNGLLRKRGGHTTMSLPLCPGSVPDVHIAPRQPCWEWCPRWLLMSTVHCSHVTQRPLNMSWLYPTLLFLGKRRCVVLVPSFENLWVAWAEDNVDLVVPVHLEMSCASEFCWTSPGQGKASRWVSLPSRIHPELSLLRR